jgi:hypothetical protein
MANIEYRIYFGKRFWKQKDGYWVNGMPIHAQRWVWINHHGAIPKGMDIHHKDGNKDNNDIENLEMLSRSDHLKKHWANPELRQKRRDFLNKQRAKVHAWLRSPEGRRVQSEASKKAWKYRKSGVKNCLSCNKEFTTQQPWAKYCSDACDKRWRRKQGVYNIEVTCPVCAKLFFKDKFSKRVFCSISCGAKSSAKKRNEPS